MLWFFCTNFQNSSWSRKLICCMMDLVFTVSKKTGQSKDSHLTSGFLWRSNEDRGFGVLLSCALHADSQQIAKFLFSQFHPSCNYEVGCLRIWFAVITQLQLLDVLSTNSHSLLVCEGITEHTMFAGIIVFHGVLGSLLNSIQSGPNEPQRTRHFIVPSNQV